MACNLPEVSNLAEVALAPPLVKCSRWKPVVAEEDSFDVLSWRRECEEELRLASGKRAHRYRGVRCENAWEAQGNATQTVSMLNSSSCFATPPSVERAQAQLRSSSRACDRAPDLNDRERALISEAIFAPQDLASHSICRGDMYDVLKMRDCLKTLSANERKRRYQEASDRQRRLAVSWRGRRERKQEIARRMMMHSRTPSKLSTSSRRVGSKETRLDGARGFAGVDEMLAQESAFRYFAEPVSAAMHPADILRCLLELGLAGNTWHERHSVNKLCRVLCSTLTRELATQPRRRRMKNFRLEASTSPTKDEESRCKDIRMHCCEFYMVELSRFKLLDAQSTISEEEYISLSDFTSEIVPEVRSHLKRIRRDRHLEALVRSTTRHSDGGIYLERDAFAKVCEKLGVDVDLAEEGAAVIGVDLRSQSALDFHGLQDVLAFAEEHTARRRAQLDRSIKEITGLDDFSFWAHRFELSWVYERFAAIDDDADELLRHSEATQLIKQMGFEPHRPGAQARAVEDFYTRLRDQRGDSSVRFVDVLRLSLELREILRIQYYDEVLGIYKNMRRKPFRDLVLAIPDAASLWKRIDSAEEIVEQLSKHRSTDMMYQDIFNLILRVLEEMRRALVHKDISCAEALGISSSQFWVRLVAFDSRDWRCVGALERDEVISALKAAGLRISNESKLTDWYSTIGVPPEARLELPDFLRLTTVVLADQRSNQLMRQLTLRQ